MSTALSYQMLFDHKILRPHGLSYCTCTCNFQVCFWQNSFIHVIHSLRSWFANFLNLLPLIFMVLNKLYRVYVVAVSSLNPSTQEQPLSKQS